MLSPMLRYRGTKCTGRNHIYELIIRTERCMLVVSRTRRSKYIASNHRESDVQRSTQNTCSLTLIIPRLKPPHSTCGIDIRDADLSTLGLFAGGSRSCDQANGIRNGIGR